MKNSGKGWSTLLVVLALCSCGERDGLAPVVESNWRAANDHVKRHVVVRGETLYAIAFRYDLDYRQLAMVNHLISPYTVRVGQVIHLQTQNAAPFERSRPVRYTRPVWHPSRQPTPTMRYQPSSAIWQWPVHGRVATTFIPQQGKKGIDIAAKKGEKIHAAAGGIVAYAGNGLRGYGNLIIIKHNNQYLTAYGNNLKNLVHEGQTIKVGQAIAEIGVVDRRFWGVHFEIRKAGKPVNPLNYLQKG